MSDAPEDDIDDALLARRLVRACDRAALGTIDADGNPYTSLVLTACDPLGAPLLLMSDLAEHSKQIAAGSAVSLLFEQSAGADAPLVERVEPEAEQRVVEGDDGRADARAA